MNREKIKAVRKIHFTDIEHELRLDERWTTVYYDEVPIATIEKRRIYDKISPVLIIFDTNANCIKEFDFLPTNRQIKTVIAELLNESS